MISEERQVTPDLTLQRNEWGAIIIHHLPFIRALPATDIALTWDDAYKLMKALQPFLFPGSSEGATR